MAAAMYADVPGYSALILRKNLPDLRQPGALIPRSKEWWSGSGAVWNVNEKTWTFPSGAVIIFGFLEYDRDIGNYMGSEYQFIGFDELTQFPRHHYVKLGTRLRKKRELPVPLRVRGASNPGDIGHEWVYQHFMVEGPEKGRVFTAAKLDDNPSLDADEYRQAFDSVDLLTRARWLDGDWTITGGGVQFKREWYEIVEDFPTRADRIVRFWDTAASAPPPGREHEADWTVGTKIMRIDNDYWVLDVVRFQGTPATVEKVISQTAYLDGEDVEIWMEQEGGASGVHMIHHYRDKILDGYAFQGVTSGSNKVVRAKRFSSASENKKVKLVRGPWLSKWFAELELFPEGENDDQVDSGAGAFNQLAGGSELRIARPNVRGFFSWQ